MSKKSNIDYLRHILDTLGNLMGENNYKESVEWLDAIQKEQSEFEGGITNLKFEIKTKEDDERYKDERIEELKEQISEYKTGEGLANQIDTRMGDKEILYWHCDNIAIQSLMETFEEKLYKLGHIQLEAALTVL